MRRMMGLGSALAVGLLTLGGDVAAQRMSTVELGVVAPGRQGPFQAGYRYSVLDRNSVGIEIAVATLPEAIIYGLVIVGADFDAAFQLSPAPEVGLVVRGGPSVIVGASGGGGGALFGYNIGAGVVLRVSDDTAMRFDYTARSLYVDGHRESVPSLTFGVAWLLSP